ncbi:22356_t:CDS:2 [Gigaspora rosea]|nr:22356_t:CDS:2 [Gigaspora rosea]
MEPTDETNLPFQYYPLYPLFEELYGSENNNNIGHIPFNLVMRCSFLFATVYLVMFFDERSLSTKALTYPFGLENTNTDDNYTVEAQPYFDFENENVIDSHEESAMMR